MPTTAPNSSVVGVLSWLLPVAGVLLWIFVLPSTRAAINGRLGRRRSQESASPPGPDQANSVEQTEPTGPRRREEDPEILRFDHAVVVSKFPGPTTPTAPESPPAS